MTTTSASRLAHDLDFRGKLRAAVLARPPGPDDACDLARTAYERAAIACGLAAATNDAGRYVQAREAFAEGAAAGAAAVLGCVLADEGEDADLVLRGPGGLDRTMPAGRSTFDASDWLRAVAGACVARDGGALAILCAPAHVDAVQRPANLADAFWRPLCFAVAGIVRGDVPATLDEAVALLAPDRIVRGDAAALRAQIAPLVPVLRALAARGDTAGPLRDAVAAHARHFATDAAGDDPYRSVSLEALGLAALAHDRGLPVADAGPAAPLVEGTVRGENVTIVVAFRERYAERELDATGFLDLRDYARAGRDHVIVRSGPHLLARYRATGRAGWPPATASFRLPGDGAGAQPPPALDPGERLALAERHARASGHAADDGDARAAAAWRLQAEGEVDAVLAAIPDGADRVPADALTSVRGRALFVAEPGRFRRDRLLAYRAGLARPPVSDARAAAMAAAGLVGEAARDLLAGIERDRTAVAALRPRADDYARVFAGDAIALARKGFDALWDAGLTIDAPAGRQLAVFAAPAGMFATENALSRRFPGGYRSIARFVDPHRVWVAWRYVNPGEESGQAYDGLVWCDDHWAWFPKPYRVLRELAAR
ncbi:MAG: Imm49 family immunity protein [Burkholderiales bacterium]